MINKFINKLNLKKQLILIFLLTIVSTSIIILYALPHILTSFYENNVYNMLKQPIEYIDIKSTNKGKDIAYAIIDNKGNVTLSNNCYKIFHEDDINLLLNNTSTTFGDLILKNNRYFYYKSKLNDYTIITFTNDTYYKIQQNNLNNILLPTIIIIILGVTSVVSIYSNYLVGKIMILKNKVDNINNNEYKHNTNFTIDDELNILNNSIENMRNEINKKEEFKNNMFQSVSHELKTPIMVISSHTEALEDGVMNKEEVIPIINEQCKKLSKYVKSILNINKLSYIKSNKELKKHKVDVNQVINDSIKKFSVVKKDITFTNKIKKELILVGDKESWELVIDNILSNFIRYADKKIIISRNKNELILYNDGELINVNKINDIFKPYEKGNNGLTGLGLSIVYMTLDAINYKIEAINKKDGVYFVIKF